MEYIKEDGKIKILSDYNINFIKGAKLIEGKWKSPYWVFPEENESAVRELLLDIYGTTGEPQETVDLLVDISEVYYTNKFLYQNDNNIYLCRRILCTRYDRDSEVRLGENVLLIKGGFANSGGSRKYPSVSPQEGTILKVKRCPVSVYERVKDLPEITLCESTGTADRKSQLLEEKERLQKRLAEIEAELRQLS